MMNMQWAPVMLIVLSLGCSHAHKEEADEGGETKLTLDAVPTAARAALIREAQGAAITTVDKEESNGKVIYETDVMLNGKNWEIKVDPDGPNRNSYPGGGAADRTLSFKTRFQIFDVSITPFEGGYDVAASHVATTLLAHESGQNFLGLSTQFAGADPTDNLRLDPESIRVAPDGTVYVSDEYGPVVYHFDASGRRLGALRVPDKFLVANPDGQAKLERANNTRGRVPSKGMEGLAITPDGGKLLAAMQGPLTQDGGDATRYTRMVLFDLGNPAAAPRDFLYKLDPDPALPGLNVSRNTVSEVVAINDHQFLVSERDGTENQTKHAYTIDIAGAQDISGIDSLASLTQARIDDIVPVAKSAQPLIDIKAAAEPYLQDVPIGYTPGIPDKIEGFAFGPDLPDRRHLLLVTNDDDFAGMTSSGGYPNYIMAFAIDPSDLPGYQAEQFTAPETFAPEPGGLIFLLTIVALTGRRRSRPPAPRTQTSGLPDNP
jgi:hypothetical protein